MTRKVCCCVAAIAFGVALAGCGGSQITIHGRYAAVCASSLTFYDGRGNQLGVANIEVETTAPPGSGGCSMGGSYSVTLDEVDTYKVEVSFLDPEGGRVFNDVITMDELRDADFEWNILTF
ncbi:MAG: hypothetical protein AB1551_05525 [Actinomycetota bacterium]